MSRTRSATLARIAAVAAASAAAGAGMTACTSAGHAPAGWAQGLVITAASAGSSPVPMMTARPAFAGAAVWFLGDAASAGLHAATLTFTAATPGTYQYLSPVPGHALDGMTGAFTVSGN